MPTYFTVFQAMMGVFGSMRILRKLLMPLNFQIKAESRLVNAIMTVRIAGRIYRTVIKIRKGDRKRYACIFFCRIFCFIVSLPGTEERFIPLLSRKYPIITMRA